MGKFMRRFMLITASSLAGTLGSFASSHAAPPAIAFGELPSSHDADISPDGKHLAVIINVGGTYYAGSQDITTAGSKMSAVVLGKGVKPKYIKWVNNKRFVISFRQSEKMRDGTPFTSSYLFTKELGEAKGRILVKPKVFRQFNDRVVDWLEDDPDHILMQYSKVAYEPYPDIYKVNVATGRDKRILRRKTGIEHWITDDTGKPRLGWGQTGGGKDRMKILDFESGDWENFDDYPGLTPDTPIYQFLNKGTEAVVGDYNGRDTLGLYIYDFEKRAITRKLFHNENYDASGVVLSSDGETVIGAKYVADKEETELLGDYGTSLSKLRSKFEDYSISYVDQTDDYEKMIIRMSAPYEPGGLYLFERKTEEIYLIQERYSDLKEEDMGNVVPVKYSARDGQKIPSFVTLPPTITEQSDLKDLPFIVLPHGGPYGRDEKQFDYLAQFFATRGYGVMQMNFRGSEGYGKAFKEAGRDNWLLMQEDVEDATRFLFKKGYADPNRTCIAGWSYGGYAALMGAAKDTENMYSCVIAMAALTDINDAKRDLAKYRGGEHAAKSFFGEAMKDSAVRKANSPVHRADDIKVPVFLAHGDQDENVQFDQFKRMRGALKKAGVKHTAMHFEDEDHFLSVQKNREAFFVGVDKFLMDVMGPSEYAAK